MPNVEVERPYSVRLKDGLAGARRLPVAQQAKDFIFRGVVHALAHAPATVAA